MEHDWCLLTNYCKRCGAGQIDVLNGDRAEQCEPGVRGISVKARGRRLGDMLVGLRPWAICVDDPGAE